MRDIDYEYIKLINKVLNEGEMRPDRTGTGTIQIPYHSIELDISSDFPAMSFKKLQFRTMLTELNWFMLGRNDIEFLHHHRCYIWDGDYERYAKDFLKYTGAPMVTQDFGKSYGWMWAQQGGYRHWAEDIRRDPYSRRHIIYNGSAENRHNPIRTALQPCHDLFEFNIHKNHINIHFHMRSVDVGLGLPFNIASYALLLHVMSGLTGYSVGKMHISLFNVHIYMNHADALKHRIDSFVADCAKDNRYNRKVEVVTQLKSPESKFGFELDAYLTDYFHAGVLTLPLST